MKTKENTINIGYEKKNISPQKCSSCGGSIIVTFTDIEFWNCPRIPRAVIMKIFCYNCQEFKDIVYSLIMASMN